MLDKRYSWKRFWCPRNGTIRLDNSGYVTDPDGPYAQYLGLDLHPFEDIVELPGLALLGEPGIGKTTAMLEEQGAINEQIRTAGGEPLWLDLDSVGSEYQLVRKLFESDKFKSWLAGHHHLHVFLDSLDECRLRIENVAALLVEELRDCPIERLYLRVSSRTADWPSTLEDGLKELWGEEPFGIYELAPLRRRDVSEAAAANDLDPDIFLRAVDEAEAVPLVIKPVTLELLLESYRHEGELPATQTELYLDGCRWLFEERNKGRIDARCTGELTADQRLAVAARIAAITVFSNKYAV
jgi:predicted NACHT family NTPase